MAKKSSNTDIAVVLLVMGVLAYIFFFRGEQSVLKAQEGGVGVDCATRSGSTSAGTPIGEKVQCGNNLFSIVGGRQNVYNIAVRVTATAEDRSFTNFRIADASPQEFRTGLSNVRPSIIESGPIQQGRSYTWSTVQTKETDRDECAAGNSKAPVCDSTEELVYFPREDSCECWLKAGDFEDEAQPVEFNAQVEGAWQGGVDTITGTSRIEIRPDLGGGFSVDVVVVS